MDGTWIKIGIGVLGAIASELIGWLGLPFVVLLCLMAIDFITGLMAAMITAEGLSSRIGRNGFIKKLYVALLIGAVYLVEMLVIKSPGVIGGGIAISYAVIEFVSIVENGGKMGVPIGPLKHVIAALNRKRGVIDGKGN